MSLSEVDSKKIEDFLTNTENDLNDFILNFMEFFVPMELRKTIPKFQKNFDLISKAISIMKKSLSDSKNFQGLQNHGLQNSELGRKIEIYNIIRNHYIASKNDFVKSFVDLCDDVIEFFPDELPKKAKDLPSNLKQLYNTSRNKLRNLKISKERFFEFLNTLLKSIADVLGVGGIVSEFKDSVEVTTKKENSPSFYVIFINSEPEFYKKMKTYYKNQNNSDLTPKI